MPTANPNVFALFPLQEVLFNKDGTGPLAYGVVTFFSDPGFSVKKDVYQETLNPDNTITYSPTDNPLILSGIGSFVDGGGNNFIPLLYPYTGTPADAVVGDYEPYYITVDDSNGVFQFSANDWPPNSFGTSTTVTAQESLTENLLSNPGFSVVSFVPAAGSSSYVYNVTGNQTNPIAPGWSLVTAGIGAITVTQQLLNQSIVGEGPYALKLAWTSTSNELTSLQLVQTLTNSPRIIAGSYANASIVAASNSSNVGLQLIYSPSNASFSTIIVSGTTTNDGSYTTITGTTPDPLALTNTDAPPGYVNFIINIQNPGINSDVELTSAQMVQVATSEIEPPYIQQTTQQELNGLMWYYEPQLAYKPIPSYAIGWDFKYNPSQFYGSSIGMSGLSANQAAYICDQTIAFESVGNVITYAISNQGLSFTTGTTTQFALIQYLDAATAYELLSASSLAVQINGVATNVNGYVSLYWSTAETLPSVPIQTNHTVFFSTLTNGIPTTLVSNWNVISNPSGQLVGSTTAAMPFSLNGTTSLTGWVPPTVSFTGTTFFAIVVSFETIPIDATSYIQYVTLNAGNIATAPAATNEAQTLQALQYYYETSYPGGPASGAVTLGAVAAPMIGMNPGGGGGCTSYAQTFSTRYVYKRAVPNITYFSPRTGTMNAINMSTYIGGAVANAADAPTTGMSSPWTPYTSQTGNLMTSIAATTYAASGSGSPAVPFYSVGTYQYVADARLGQV